MKLWTPILDYKTGEPLKIGDKCINERGNYGTLQWDDYFNRYYLRSVSGGNVVSRAYTKVSKLEANKHDTTNVECRSNNKKQKW
jgi:hypothetical protein